MQTNKKREVVIFFAVIFERINTFVALRYEFQHSVVVEIFAVRFAVTDEQLFALACLFLNSH
jgi:hypothetical protein